MRRAIRRRRTGRDRSARAGSRLDVKVARLVALLAPAKLSSGPVLSGSKRQRRGRATGTAVGENGAVGERDGDRVEAVRAAEDQHRGLGLGLAGERGQVGEPVAVRAAGEVGLAQGGGEGPGEVCGDGVVVGEDAAVGLEELAALVVEVGGLEVDDGIAAVEGLVDRLAVVCGAGVGAKGLGGGHDAGALKLEPDVAHAVLRGEDADLVRRAGVAGVCVAKDKDGVADGPGVDVVGDLVEVAVAGREVARLGAGVGVEVVDVHIDALGDAEAHEGEALGRQAVGPGGIGAG